MEHGAVGQGGHVEGLYVAAAAKSPCEARDDVEAVAGRGLVGDRYAEGLGTWWKPEKSGQHLTLIAAEVLDALRDEQGIALSDADARRNVVTRGVALGELMGRRFSVGEVECIGVRDCPPCAHLEGLTVPGVHAALEGKGGLRAEILTGGRIAVGDSVTLLP
jgi:MOSC domain-containing protein YiiM